MQKLTIKLSLYKRKKVHIRRLRSRIYELKYEILNEALTDRKVSNNNIDLFYKYNRRLKLITFLRNG